MTATGSEYQRWSSLLSPKRVMFQAATYDHTSVLKLIELKWNLPPLTERDAAATGPFDMVDFGKPVFDCAHPAGTLGALDVVTAPQLRTSSKRAEFARLWWSERRESNPAFSAWEADVLPLYDARVTNSVRANVSRA